MGFGDKNKNGGFGPKGAPFGASLSNTNGSNFGGNSNGGSGIGPSVNSGGFGSKTTPSAGQSQNNGGLPTLFKRDVRDDELPTAVKKTTVVTFSNVVWKKFDNIGTHPTSSEYPNEPSVHVLAEQNRIEFAGYNISEMDEGVYYVIGKDDNFEIECNVDTSKVLEHPNGYFYIAFGIISAHFDHRSGSFFLEGRKISNVQKQFRMRLSLSGGGKYEIYINGTKEGEAFKATAAPTRIEFGFKHAAHNCEKISRAYMSGIRMKQSRTSESGGFGPSAPKSGGFHIK